MGAYEVSPLGFGALVEGELGLNYTARWSDGGLAALLGGRYRYISPVAPPAECEVLSRAPFRIRPLRIRTAGLTNDPNLRGKPLSNRRTEDDPAATQTQTGNTPMLKTETIAAILACCGLPPEASDEQVLAAIPDCENKMKCFDGLKNRHDALLAAQVDSDLEQYSAVITADAKPKWKTALLANRESALALLSGITVPTETTQAAALTNRATAKNPADASAEADLKKATARAGVIRNRATELRAANPRMSLATAYAAAEEEINAKAN